MVEYKFIYPSQKHSEQVAIGLIYDNSYRIVKYDDNLKQHDWKCLTGTEIIDLYNQYKQNYFRSMHKALFSNEPKKVKTNNNNNLIKWNDEKVEQLINWKLITDMSKEKGVIINKNVFEDVIVQNGKHYFVIFRLKGNEIPWKIYKLEIGKPNSMSIYSDGLKDIKAFYRWDGVSEPETPTIDKNTGEITDWNVENQNKVKDFLNNYLDVIIQENIRVQQGGNPNYESSIVGTQRIIFDFEIIDESQKMGSWYFIKKSIYRMILTIGKSNNIIAGSLELTQLRHAVLMYLNLLIKMKN